MKSPVLTNDLLSMGVDNMDALVERIAADCPKNQFLREFTQNSIDARSTDIYWGYDDTFVSGVRKLSITDNGTGMSPGHLLHLINNLSASSHTQALNGNFGIGAKISSLKDNPYGIVYHSWQNGAGAQIWLCRDSQGRYGLKQYTMADGTEQAWLPLLDSDKPDQIKQNGTKVIFLGKSPEHETFYPDNIAGPQTSWIRSYLNKRYFTLPSGINVHTVSGSKNKWEWQSRVHGQWDFLNDNCMASDTKQIGDFTVYWWLLKDDAKALKNFSGQYNNRGHVAAILDDELYEVQDSYKARTALQNFGIFTGHERVVIYVQVDDPSKIVSNMVRDKLIYNGGELPWISLGESFQKDLPQPLQDYLEGILNKSEQPDHEDKIIERLKRIEHLLLEPTFRRSAQGADVIDLGKEKTNIRLLPDRKKEPKPDRKSSKSDKAKPETPNSRFPFNAEAGKTAEPEQKIDYPKVVFISVANGMRSINDDMEGHAAQYIGGEQNMLQVNRDFGPMQKLIEDWKQQYKNVPGSTHEITNTIEQWYAQVLVETVIRTRQYGHTNPWRNTSVDDMLTPASLTAAAMQIYFLNDAVAKSLALKLKSLKDRDSRPAVA